MKFVQPVAVTDDGGFTRAGTASYFDRNGVLRTAPIDEPRLSYPLVDLTPRPSGGAWQAGPSLLLPASSPGEDVQTPEPVTGATFLFEAAATNLMTDSQDLSGWGTTAVTITANASAAPDGTVTADRVKPTTASTAIHGIEEPHSGEVDAGAQVACSIFLRSAGFGVVTFRCMSDSGAPGFGMTVDLVAGEIVSSGAFGGGGANLAAARLYGIPGGWYRLEMEGSCTAETTYVLKVHIGNLTDAYVGDGVAGVDVWGAQFEAGAVSSYISTAGGTRTRAADVGSPVLVSNVPESEPVHSLATTYAAGAVVRGTGPLAHTAYLSLAAGNLNRPLTDEEWWLETGLTNRWRAFDEAVATQTSNPDEITFIIRVPERINSIVLLNIEAATARITMTSETGEVVFDNTTELYDNRGITNWYRWFFSKIRRIKSHMVIGGLPPFARAQIRVTLLDEGNTARCGVCVVGEVATIGTTLVNPELGMLDFSKKDRDQFGSIRPVKREYSRRSSFSILVDNAEVDGLYELLPEYRATAIVWIGSEAYRSTLVYGFFKDFRIVIPDNKKSLAALDLESIV